MVIMGGGCGFEARWGVFGKVKLGYFGRGNGFWGCDLRGYCC